MHGKYTKISCSLKYAFFFVSSIYFLERMLWSQKNSMKTSRKHTCSLNTEKNQGEKIILKGNSFCIRRYYFFLLYVIHSPQSLIYEKSLFYKNSFATWNSFFTVFILYRINFLTEFILYRVHFYTEFILCRVDWL